MFDYKIKNTALWYKILKKYEDDSEEYLDVNGEWNKNETWAKLFFHREDAVSALVLVRRLWDLKGRIKSGPEKKVERQSWSEF